jgi:hypothetical protein
MSRRPYKYAFAALVLALATACAPKPADTPAASGADKSAIALQEAMDADRAFNDDAQKMSLADAFGKWMDKTEGKMIGPGSISVGEAAIRAGFEGTPSDLKLIWSPDMGSASTSGDMAVTSGRWKREKAGQVIAEGRYVTVWHKAAEGWRGLFDLGNPDPKPAAVRPPDPEGRPG